MKRPVAIVLVVLYAASLVLGIMVLFTNRQQQQEAKIVSGLDRRKNKIVVIRVSGPISASDMGGFRENDSDRIVKRLKRAREDDQVKAVILRINSPGGTVAAVQEIHAEVKKLQKAGKKVIASMSDVAASGGYYIACSADEIVANPGTLTGSIGVILQLGNLQGLFQKVGVTLDVIKAGEHKDIGSIARALTPKERQLLQDMINDAYNQFVEAVREGRKLDLKQVQELADGEIWTGSQAKSKKLVDRLGGLQDAMERAKELSGVTEARIVEDQEPWERFLRMIPTEKSRIPFLGAGPAADAALAISGGWRGASLAYLMPY